MKELNNIYELEFYIDINGTPEKINDTISRMLPETKDDLWVNDKFYTVVAIYPSYNLKYMYIYGHKVYLEPTKIVMMSGRSHPTMLIQVSKFTSMINFIKSLFRTR